MFRLQNKFFLSEQYSLKNSSNRWILSSIFESSKLINFYSLINKLNYLEFFFFKTFYSIHQDRELANCLIKDLIHMVNIWRQIRGYPQGGNTTHTNARSSRKNKILLNFRIQQFFKMFGQKRRNIYPTLVKAEYNNRLWFYNWQLEWYEANLFAFRMANAGQKAGSFNPVLLAGNQVNGFKRMGKAAKMSKAKKLVKLYTLGAPLLFTKYIYYASTPADFPRIVLRDEVNKRLGKKLRKREYKKKSK